MIKVFVAVLFSVFTFCVSGCEETYGKQEKTDTDYTADTSDTDTDTSANTATDTGSSTDTGDDTDTDISADTGTDTGTDTDSSTDTGDDTSTDTDSGTCDEEKINSVVIGTYNTHLFFDKICDSGNCTSSDFEKVPSDSEYKTKVSELAESIHEIDADIILLQEVEKNSCLKDLFEKSGSYDDFYLGDKNYSGSVNTAVMTKGKIIYENKHQERIDCSECDGGKTTFSHTFLETRIKLGCRDIIVFSAHFKSKNNDDQSRRLAEAAAAVKILKERAAEYPDALIVMGGDLNDEPGSDTLDFFESDPAFLRVANELSSKDQATYSYRGEAIAIDHIFWVKSSLGSYKQGSAEVVKDAPSWYSLGSSDHAALKATFEF